MSISINVSMKNACGGSIVIVKSFRNEEIDSFFVPKFNGIKYCQNSNGMFAKRFDMAKAKATKIFWKNA